MFLNSAKSTVHPIMIALGYEITEKVDNIAVVYNGRVIRKHFLY